MEAVSSLGNGPRFVSQTTIIFLVCPPISLLSSYKALSFVTIEVSHNAYPVFAAPLQLQIQRAVAELLRWMAIPCAMSAIFILGQSKLFRYSAIPLFRIQRLQRSCPG